MGLVSTVIEENGISTVTLAMESDVVAPRVARVAFPYNFPMGEPGNQKQHEEVARAALALLHDLCEPRVVELPFRWRDPE